MRLMRKPLSTIELPEYYVWQGETRLVRSYQREAMQALDQAIELPISKLPTGMGKTDLISLQLIRLIEAGYAERVLFLVDQQLAKQALEAIQDILDYVNDFDILAVVSLPAGVFIALHRGQAKTATLAQNDYNLAAGRYKPQLAEEASGDDPAELIREVLVIEQEITAGLERLLQVLEAVN